MLMSKFTENLEPMKRELQLHIVEGLCMCMHDALGWLANFSYFRENPISRKALSDLHLYNQLQAKVIN